MEALGSLVEGRGEEGVDIHNYNIKRISLLLYSLIQSWLLNGVDINFRTQTMLDRSRSSGLMRGSAISQTPEKTHFRLKQLEREVQRYREEIQSKDE